MKFAPFLLSAQIYCAFVAALQYGFMPDEHDTSKLMEKEHLVSLNGRRVGTGDKRHAWKHHHSLMEEHSEHSEDSNNEEKWKWLEKRGDVVEPLLRERALQARAAGLEVAGVTVDEEFVLAYILEQTNLGQGECPGALKKYCDKLENVKDALGGVYPLVGEICDETSGEAKRTEKCKSLQQTIQEKGQKLKTKLEAFKTKANKQPDKITDEDCKDEINCYLFQEADDKKPYATNKLKENCNDLRNACYQKKRRDVANEILMRVLRGHLKEKKKKDDECKTALQEKCPLLVNGSQELFQKCLKLNETCPELIKKVEKKCKALKEALEKALNKENDTLKMECPTLLKDCYFYKDNCDGSEEDCEKLEDKCRKEKVVYNPPGFPFDPIEKESELVKAGADELYEEAASEGVIIESLHGVLDATYLLAFVVPKGDIKNVNKCKAKLGEGCKYYKTWDGLKELCDEDEASDKGKKACEEVKDTIDNKCNEFKKELHGKSLSTESDGKSSAVKGWYELNTIGLDKDDCRTLQAKCHYLAQHSWSSLNNACRNLRAACYKKGLDDAAYERLEGLMRGKMNKTEPAEVIEMALKLLEKGQELGSQVVEVFALLLNPKTAYERLRSDIYRKSTLLLLDLNYKRDVPNEKTCLFYPKRGDILKKDDPDLIKPLKALEENCRFLQLAKDLKNKFEVKDVFKTTEKCVKWLNEKHPTWMRRRHKDLSWLGNFAEKACDMITTRVVENCHHFEDNLDKYSEKFSKETPAEECELWTHYCKKIESHCNTKKSGITKKCKPILGNCTFILEKRKIDDEIMYELAGKSNITGECETYINHMCTLWKNKTLNNQINTIRVTLCGTKNEDSGDDDDGDDDDNSKSVREEVCNRIAERVEVMRITLETTLPIAKEELTRKRKEYDELKKKAIKALEDAGILLTKKTGQTVARLVKRNEKLHMKVVEAEALDLVAWAMDLYFELDGECKERLRECKFVNECPDCKAACDGIITACKGLEPLMVDIPLAPAIPEGEQKPTEPEKPKEEEGKTTSTSEGGKVCESVSTKDVWVTQTVTHTHTTTSTQTQTSKVTVTSTRKCKPTQCTTDKGGHTGGGGDEKEEVVPSRGSIVWLPRIGWVLVLVSVVAVWM